MQRSLIAALDEFLMNKAGTREYPPSMPVPREYMAGENGELAFARKAPRSTGTVIVGVRWRDGVVMAADRLTMAMTGEAMSRTTIKLNDIGTHAVIGTCGWAAFAQHVAKELRATSDVIASKIKRPVSFEGMGNLLQEIIRVKVSECPWWFHLSFGAILCGYDRLMGGRIAEFDLEGGIYEHHGFFADGSGGIAARTYLEGQYKPDFSYEEAIGNAIEAVRAAGKQMTTVSHPMDAVPTVKVISAKGITQIPEKDVGDFCVQRTREEYERFSPRKTPRKKRVRRA